MDFKTMPDHYVIESVLVKAGEDNRLYWLDDNLRNQLRKLDLKKNKQMMNNKINHHLKVINQNPLSYEYRNIIKTRLTALRHASREKLEQVGFKFNNDIHKKINDFFEKYKDRYKPIKHKPTKHPLEDDHYQYLINFAYNLDYKHQSVIKFNDCYVCYDEHNKINPLAVLEKVGLYDHYQNNQDLVYNRLAIMNQMVNEHLSEDERLDFTFDVNAGIMPRYYEVLTIVQSLRDFTRGSNSIFLKAMYGSLISCKDFEKYTYDNNKNIRNKAAHGQVSQTAFKENIYWLQILAIMQMALFIQEHKK